MAGLKESGSRVPLPSPKIATGGYHPSIRLHRANDIHVMQYRRLPNVADARKESRRIFGQMHWLTGDQAGLHNQPSVIEIAELTIKAAL
ncbi:MAG TPA: hypothetical protein VNY05_03210 [Candidatus Acidoferrales bacterium]|nr:hypothetical protein [Candidatus Acidoferrales bacterium]